MLDIESAKSWLKHERPHWPSLWPPIIETPFLTQTHPIDYKFSPWWLRLRAWWEGRLRRLGAEIPWGPLPVTLESPLHTVYVVEGLGLVMHPTVASELRLYIGNLERSAPSDELRYPPARRSWLCDPPS